MSTTENTDPLAAARAARGGRRDGIIITDRWRRGPRPGKRWQARVRDTYAHKYIFHTTDDRRKAEAWAKSEQKRLTEGTTTALKPRLSLWRDRYVQDLTESGKSASAVRIVKLACSKAIEAGFDDLTMPDYGRRMKSWLAGLKAEKEDVDGKVRRVDHLELSNSSRNTYLRVIRTVTKRAARECRFYDPLISVTGFKVDKSTKPIFTPAELRQLLSPERAGHSAYLATAVMVYTGCRADEGMHLRWEDIDLASGTVQIRNNTGANVKGDKERSFRLQPELRTIMEAEGRRRWGDLWETRARGFIIPDDSFRRHKKDGSLDRGHYNALADLVKEAGVKVMARRSPHSLRHTHAALRVATGESPFRIQSDLGHEGIEMTRHYSREESMLRGHVEGWPNDGTLWLLRTPPKTDTLTVAQRAAMLQNMR